MTDSSRFRGVSPASTEIALQAEIDRLREAMEGFETSAHTLAQECDRLRGILAGIHFNTKPIDLKSGSLERRVFIAGQHALVYEQIHNDTKEFGEFGEFGDD